MLGPVDTLARVVVEIAFVGSLVINWIVFEPGAHPAAFFVGFGLSSAAMILVCCLKGEPPAWHRGES